VSDGPLWIRCHDLCRWLFAEMAPWPAPAAELTGRPLFAEACAVWCAVAIARAQPDRRAAELRAADSALVRVRTLGALAPFDPAAQLGFGEQTAAIGRMIGGWRRYVARGGRPGRRRDGTQPIAASAGIADGI